MKFLPRWYFRVVGSGIRGASLWFGAVLLLALGVLYVFDPETCSFYPVCPTYRWFDWKCATCGGLRTVHSLLHGKFAAAWNYNPFVVSVIGCGLWETVRSLIWGANPRRLGWFGIAALAGAVMFTLARN